MAKTTSPARQLAFPEMCPVTEAVNALAASGVEERGAVFTRREVVDFILDLTRYTADRALHRMRLLEPSCGDGDFLLPALDRLLEAIKRHRAPLDNEILLNAISATELHESTFASTSAKVIDRLRAEGLATPQAVKLARAWLHCGDFLLQKFDRGFDFVVGNPPYVRQELIPSALMREYRARYCTIYDRADLYVPFIERSLQLLANGGKLGFICADRWMKNRYGGPLRKLVAESFHLDTYVDMVDTPAFHSEVIAYPAITVIARDKGRATRVAHRPEISSKALAKLSSALLSKKAPPKASGVKVFERVASGDAPWILDASDQLAVLRRLESELPLLEQTGCKVGIGVATGADKAFIGPFDELDVEADRKLPLVMTRDILTGRVEWRGYGVVNPFDDSGGLVELRRYPRLRRYLESKKDQIASRHVAQKAPANWYRTIDRIYPALTYEPKLLIPDIKSEAHIVYEDGKLYPHHNLYYITSREWDLKALRAVLRSGIARLFISTYSTRMRGGYLRFQAQYLRRIRLPLWKDVPAGLKKQLIAAAEREDDTACNKAVFKLYGLSATERAAIGGNGE